MPTINQLVREGRTSCGQEIDCSCAEQRHELTQKSSYRYSFTSEERRMHIGKDSYS